MSITMSDLMSKGTRVIRWYPIPESVQKFTGVPYKYVGIQELLTSEERLVYETASEASNVAALLLEKAFVGVDKVVSTEASGDRIRILSSLPPKIRSLVQSAFTSTHYASNDEVKGFLDGVEIVAG